MRSKRTAIDLPIFGSRLIDMNRALIPIARGRKHTGRAVQYLGTELENSYDRVHLSIEWKHSRGRPS